MTDHDLLVAGGRGGDLVLWDLDTSEPAPMSVAAHSGPITAIAMNDNGGKPATAGADRRPVVRDVTAEAKKITEFETRATVTMMAFSGDTLVTVEDGNRVTQWPLNPNTATTQVCDRVDRWAISSDEWNHCFGAPSGLPEPCRSTRRGRRPPRERGGRRATVR